LATIYCVFHIYWYKSTYGAVLFRGSKWDEALAVLSKVVKLLECRAGDHFFMSMLQHVLGNRDSAEKHLDAGIQWMDQNRQSRTQYWGGQEDGLWRKEA